MLEPQQDPAIRSEAGSDEGWELPEVPELGLVLHASAHSPAGEPADA